MAEAAGGMTDTAPGQTSYVDNYYARVLKDDKRWPALGGTVDTDVCVIGGGLAGLNTALGLVERGKKAVLLEAQRIGYSSSGRNGGSVAKGYAAGEGDLAGKIGLPQAQQLVKLTNNARKLIKKRMTDFGIDAGPVDGVLTVSWRDNPDQLKRYIEEANRNFDLGLEFMDRKQVREQCKTQRYYDGIFTNKDFHFNPLNYLFGLAHAVSDKGGRIFEDSAARKITRDGAGWRVETDAGTVRAQHVVLCCAAYVEDLNRRLGNAAFPVRSYILSTKAIDAAALKSALDTRYAVAELMFCSNYYRIVEGNRLLWGGRVGLGKQPKDLESMILHDIFKLYPQLKGHVEPDVAWSCQMWYAPHKMPQIGQLEPGYWYNTAYGGHGLCPTTAGGEAVAAAIAEGDQTYKQFETFGLSYAGGKLGRYVAQMVYWWWRAQDFASLRLKDVVDF